MTQKVAGRRHPAGSRIQGRPAALGDVLRSGPLLWAGSCLVAGSAVAYVVALKTTLVANVMLLNATSPLWTAVFAALLLGERFGAATVLAITVGGAGIVVMVPFWAAPSFSSRSCSRRVPASAARRRW